MNANAANIIVQGMLKGTYDVFDALLSLSFKYDAKGSGDLAAGELAGLMTAYPVSMRAKIKGGGGVAILYSMNEASQLVNLTATGEATPKDALDDGDIEMFKEIADSALGGGVANLSEKFGQDVELDAVDVVVAGPEGEPALREVIGDSVVQTAYDFSADPHFSGTSIILYAEPLEQRVPAGLLGGAEEPLVSDEEMQDILSGFDNAGSAHSGSGSPEDLPENLSVILDIELTAMARLGNVEMPIAEILNFGPGSIIEVGHLVDEPVELLVNNKLIARGDVVVVDEKFGLRITEIVSPQERIESLR